MAAIVVIPAAHVQHEEEQQPEGTAQEGAVIAVRSTVDSGSEAALTSIAERSDATISNSSGFADRQRLALAEAGDAVVKEAAAPAPHAVMGCGLRDGGR